MTAPINLFAFVHALQLKGVRLKNRPAQATLADAAIGIMVFAVVVGAVAIPVVQDSFVLDTETVTNELHNSSGSLPEVITTDNVEDGVVEDSETVVFQDSFDGSTATLTRGDNYTVDYDAGQFNFSTVAGANSTDDQYNFTTYDFKPDGFVGGTAGTVLGFVVTMLALALFVAAISLVL